MWKPKVRRFRFENTWLWVKDYKQVVSDCCAFLDCLELLSKLSECRNVLFRWGKEIESNYESQLLKCHNTIKLVRLTHGSNRITTLKEVQKQYEELLLR